MFSAGRGAAVGTVRSDPRLGLYNTSLGVDPELHDFTLPFTVWVLTTFMGQLPH